MSLKCPERNGTLTEDIDPTNFQHNYDYVHNLCAREFNYHEDLTIYGNAVEFLKNLEDSGQGSLVVGGEESLNEQLSNY